MMNVEKSGGGGSGSGIQYQLRGLVGATEGGGWENNAIPGRREGAAAGPTRDRENPGRNGPRT